MAHYRSINHAKQFIAFYSPKCGSTTLKEWFASSLELDEPGETVVARHQIQARDVEKYPSYRRIFFIRNPFHRLVSFYCGWVVRERPQWCFADNAGLHRLEGRTFTELIETLSELARQGRAFQHHLRPQLEGVEDVAFDVVIPMERFDFEIGPLNQELGIRYQPRRRNLTLYDEIQSDYVYDQRPEELALVGVPSFERFYNEDLVGSVSSLFRDDISFYELHSGRSPHGRGAGEPALTAAARRGDARSVESLLLHGADPDLRNPLGETALHVAARSGHAQTAACLLAHGCSHTLVDDEGRTPLSLDSISIEMLHAIRQRYRRFKSRGRPGGQAHSERVEDWTENLDRRGILKISGLIEPGELAQLQRDFGEFQRPLEDRVSRGEAFARHYDEEEHWWPKDQAYVSNNAFKYSRQLARLCCHEPLLELINTYLGRRALISRGLAMRYLPTEQTENDMFGWHHDMEEMRLKIMVLLTDVGPSDQTMSYILGSHRMFHPYSMFFTNRCGLDYCREHLDQIEIFSTTGQAGDVFLFDSNGAHRGNRRLDARVRDTFFVEFTTDRSNVWGGDVPLDVFDEMALPYGNPFAYMMSVEKKWDRPITRKATSWVEHLPQVDKWVTAVWEPPVVSRRTTA